jgi:glycerol-3-phosphate dehydrogenase
MSAADATVAIVGGGVIGVAVAHALAGVGTDSVVLEAEQGLALAASGTNSGILHTGFDSPPGQLETALILRAAELREQLLASLAVPVVRCGALLRPRDEREREAVARLAANARANGVDAYVEESGALAVPGEAVTDPVAFVHALAGAAVAGGASVECSARVLAVRAAGSEMVELELADGRRPRARAVVNCAGLHADEVARLAGDDELEVYPRKGEFLVFETPAAQRLERILLPVPTALGKGVLVFPTVDGRIVAGPTARERVDKHDWSVEPDAGELILARACNAYPPLRECRQIGAYAGLRPAGRERNYAIERSRAMPGLIHVAAIRSTGLSSSLAVGEHVVSMLAHTGAVDSRAAQRARLVADEHGGVTPPARPLPALPAQAGAGEWWQRAARYRAARVGDEGGS